MVVAVDFDDWFAQYIGDMCAFLDLHFMHEHGPHVARIGMIEGIGELIREVSVERPTQPNIDELASAADAKERFAV